MVKENTDITKTGIKRQLLPINSKEITKYIIGTFKSAYREIFELHAGPYHDAVMVECVRIKMLHSMFVVKMSL